MALVDQGVPIEWLYRTLAHRMLRARSRNWPAAGAIVTRTHRPKNKCACDLVIIHYRYFVAGQKYRGIHKEPFMIALPGSFMRQYPPGKEISVRYNPNDPSRSVALI